MSPAEVISAFWELMNTNDFRAVGRLLSDDYSLEYPQSDETFYGPDKFARINEDYPANGKWHFTVHKFIAEGSEVVTDVSVTDSVVEARVITFSTVKDGLILRQLEFWPEPFQAPEWRRVWTKTNPR